MLYYQEDAEYYRIHSRRSHRPYAAPASMDPYGSPMHRVYVVFAGYRRFKRLRAARLVAWRAMAARLRLYGQCLIDCESHTGCVPASPGPHQMRYTSGQESGVIESSTHPFVSDTR